MEAKNNLSLPTVYDQMDGRANADFVECGGCEHGIVERVADDHDGDTGRVGYQYLNGCVTVRVESDSVPKGIWLALCAACAAAEKVSA